jgi:hypothetical protein
MNYERSSGNLIETARISSLLPVEDAGNPLMFGNMD